MSWFGKLFSGGVGSVITAVGDVADRFIETDDEKRLFKQEMAVIVQARESELEQTIRAELSAKERILVAELNQGDNYTKRARPTVVYFGLVLIGVNYCVFPVLAAFADYNGPLALPLPTEFWAAWGGIVATWSIGRSAEKRGASSPISRMITGNKPTHLLD